MDYKTSNQIYFEIQKIYLSGTQEDDFRQIIIQAISNLYLKGELDSHLYFYLIQHPEYYCFPMDFEE